MSLEVPKNYWSRASETARHVFRSGQFETLDEQAGPAYLEGNLLSRWVFWRRLKHVLRRLPEPRGETCVDFGCGFGLLLPALATRYSEVVGVDLVPDLSRAYLERWSERSGEFLDGVRIRSSLEDSGLGEASVDVMIALDVLEHCDDLGAVLDSMRRLLRPGGLLLVTGPDGELLLPTGPQDRGLLGRLSPPRHLRHCRGDGGAFRGEGPESPSSDRAAISDCGGKERLPAGLGRIDGGPRREFRLTSSQASSPPDSGGRSLASFSRSAQSEPTIAGAGGQGQDGAGFDRRRQSTFKHAR